jgi:hypothetical protein
LKPVIEQLDEAFLERGGDLTPLFLARDLARKY